MKKLVLFALVLTMLFSLAACGASDKDADAPENEISEPAPEPAPEDAPEESGDFVSGVASPMTAVDSLEDLAEQADCALMRPEGVKIDNEAFNVIAGDPQIAQYDFTADGKSCTLRFAKADIGTDISGVYYDGNTLYAADTAENSYHQTDDVIAHRWFTVDGQYVFIANNASEWEWADYDAVSSQFTNMEPKNWHGDVPFADYLALTGTYTADDSKSMASVSVRGDHALLTVYTYPDDETMFYWEMDAVLKDGKLVYEKETISRRVVDAENGTADLVPEADGGAGFVEVLDDGSLSFAGAYSEALLGLILARVR